MEEQRKEAWETYVLSICQGNLTATKEKKNNFSVYCLPTIPFGCSWSGFSYFCQVVIQRPRLLQSNGFIIPWGLLNVLFTGSSASGQNTGGKNRGLCMGGLSLPTTFHWAELINMALCNFKGGWGTWPISMPSGEREMFWWITRQSAILSKVFRLQEPGHIFEWIEHRGDSTQD